MTHSSVKNNKVAAVPPTNDDSDGRMISMFHNAHDNEKHTLDEDPFPQNAQDIDSSGKHDKGPDSHAHCKSHMDDATMTHAAKYEPADIQNLSFDPDESSDTLKQTVSCCASSKPNSAGAKSPRRPSPHPLFAVPVPAPERYSSSFSGVSSFPSIPEEYNCETDGIFFPHKDTWLQLTDSDESAPQPYSARGKAHGAAQDAVIDILPQRHLHVRKESTHLVPSTNQNPYFNSALVTLDDVFTAHFHHLYIADYSLVNDVVEISPGFIPPNIPPIQINDANDGCCNPVLDGFGCRYFGRLFVSALGHVLFLGCVALIGYLVIMGQPIQKEVYIALGATYVIVFVDSLMANDLQNLRRMRSAQRFKKFMKEVRAAKPVLVLTVENYHYENRSSTHIFNIRGKRNIQHVNKKVKVVTHRENEHFEFSEHVDRSPLDIHSEGKKATKIRFYRTFSFADNKTRNAFEFQSASMRERNRMNDHHMTYYENFSIPGFEDSMMVFLDPDAQRRCLNPCVYMVAGLVLCTWPFRWWFRNVTARTSFTFVKKLKI